MSSKVSKKNRFQLKKPELSERNQKQIGRAHV